MIPETVQASLKALNDADESLEAKRVAQTEAATTKAQSDQLLTDATQAVADQTAARSQAFKDFLTILAASYED